MCLFYSDYFVYIKYIYKKHDSQYFKKADNQ